MSVIAIRGVPQKWNLMSVVKILAKAINGHFEALNFQPGGKIKGVQMKICYLRLSEKLDPVRVVENINSTTFPKQFRPFAFVPDVVPDIPLASKRKMLPQKMRRALRLADDNPPEKVLTLINDEILAELQSKYPGLYSVSKKTGHKLMAEVAKKINARLKVVVENNKEVAGSCYKMSQMYRRAHPHFGDFELVLSTLHVLQDAAGTARTQLSEKELSAVPPNPFVIDNLPFNKIQPLCDKYSDRIIKKISEHVNNLKSEVTQNDTEDEVVRKKVREELKKMTPFLPMIVKQVMTTHFLPKRAPHFRIRIYGEPFLPNKETMSPFLKRYQAVALQRSERMYNLLRFNVPSTHFASLMAMDATVLNGAKLVIRSSDMPQIKVSQTSIAGSGVEEVEPEEPDQEEEEWDEMM